MKFSIGHRLFVSVLLGILAVAVTGIALMRQNVMQSFRDYAVKIELDRLDQLAGVLGERYRDSGNWGFIADGERRQWIGAELARLQRQRLMPGPVPSRAQAPQTAAVPALPAAPASPPAPASPLSPPSPPSPPAPPPPPPPPSPVAPLPPPAVPLAPMPPPDSVGVDDLALQDRVTLVDEAGGYLAGRNNKGDANAYRTVAVDGATVGYLVVAKAARPSDAMSAVFVDQIKTSLLIIAALSIVLSALVATVLAAHFRTPILRLAGGARALAEGRFDTRLGEGRSDELGDLARSFNQLAERLGRAETSRRQWVADTSHELRTPLSVLRAQLEAVQDGVREPDPQTLASMLRQVLSLNALIDQLYALARADVGELAYERSPVDPWELACEQAAAFEQKMRAAGLTLHVEAGIQGVTVNADAERLRQVLTNLFENCIRYCRRGDHVQLDGRVNGAFAEIDVDDCGPGVDAAALARLGERFYRAEGSRSREHGGAGLGLALCKRVIEAHGGQLLAERSPLGGLRVRLRLPLEGE